MNFLLHAIPEGFLIGPYFTVNEVSARLYDRKQHDLHSFALLFVKCILEFSWNDPNPNSKQVANDYIFKFIYFNFFFGFGYF